MAAINKKFHRSSWLVTILLVSITIFHLLFTYLPGRKVIRRLRNEIEYRQLYITDAANVSKSLADAQHELAEVKSYIENWRRLSSSVHSLPSLYGNINQLSKQAGATTMLFEPQAIVELNVIRQIPIHMACTGTFTQVYDFISALEGLPQTIWIDSLRFDNNGQNGDNIFGEISLVVFSDNLNIPNYIEGNK